MTRIPTLADYAGAAGDIVRSAVLHTDRIGPAGDRDIPDTAARYAAMLHALGEHLEQLEVIEERRGNSAAAELLAAAARGCAITRSALDGVAPALAGARRARPSEMTWRGNDEGPTA